VYLRRVPDTDQSLKRAQALADAPTAETRRLLAQADARLREAYRVLEETRDMTDAPLLSSRPRPGKGPDPG
jgi:hypothetical protein